MMEKWSRVKIQQLGTNKAKFQLKLKKNQLACVLPHMFFAEKAFSGPNSIF